MENVSEKTRQFIVESVCVRKGRFDPNSCPGSCYLAKNGRCRLTERATLQTYADQMGLSLEPAQAENAVITRKTRPARRETPQSDLAARFQKWASRDQR